MTNSNVACPVQCLCVVQLAVKQDKVEDVKTLSQYFLLLDNILLLTKYII